MPGENVDLVRRLFAAYSEGGLDAEVLAGLFHPEVVWNPADEAPQHGFDAVRAYMERWESGWEELSTDAEEFIEAGDRVIVAVHFAGRGRASGIEVDALLYEVYETRDGLIVRMDEFADRAEAMAAANISE
jgi:ketosteroid isomerase-like protein